MNRIVIRLWFTCPSFRSTSRPMDHNNNHQSNDETNSIKTSDVFSLQLIDKISMFLLSFSVHPQKISMKNRTRLPLQPSSQQISSILPSTKKQKSFRTSSSTRKKPFVLFFWRISFLQWTNVDQRTSDEIEEKFRRIVFVDERRVRKKLRQHRNRSLTNRISVENSNPTTNDVVPTKKTFISWISNGSDSFDKSIEKKTFDKKNFPRKFRQIRLEKRRWTTI